MNLSSEEILHELNSKEIDCLKSIYNHRCLTEEQLYQLHFKENNEENNNEIDLCKKAIRRLLKYEVIDDEEHFVGTVYFLTTLGINVVRIEYDLPTNIYDYKKRVVRRGYYRAGELRIKSRYINHQHSLNEFMIGFKNYEHDIAWKYYDEKHISAFRGIRPDGLLNVADIDFFIEIDMNTESSKQLYDKWNNYRRFLASQEYAFNERKVIVLFVIENAKYPQTRINLVKHTIEARIMDKIDSNFEMYVDTMDNLLELVDIKIKASQGKLQTHEDEIFKALAMHGFSVAHGALLSEYTGDIVYDIYARKIDEANHIIVEDGKLQEFVVDSYYASPISVLKKIASLNKTNSYFSRAFNRELTYIVVAESEEQIFKDLQLLDLIEMNNVVFTTMERLEQAEDFKNALIQFDVFGNIYSFKDAAFRFRQFEGEIG